MRILRILLALGAGALFCLILILLPGSQHKKDKPQVSGISENPHPPPKHTLCSVVFSRSEEYVNALQRVVGSFGNIEDWSAIHVVINIGGNVTRVNHAIGQTNIMYGTCAYLLPATNLQADPVHNSDWDLAQQYGKDINTFFSHSECDVILFSNTTSFYHAGLRKILKKFRMEDKCFQFKYGQLVKIDPSNLYSKSTLIRPYKGSNDNLGIFDASTFFRYGVSPTKRISQTTFQKMALSPKTYCQEPTIVLFND